ncbi:MAG TPA: FGGY-family carbohydrate kinase, partial [Burkholderiaceae bacterium]
LMQFQADLIGLPVVRPQVVETTALGAARLAALGAGLLHEAAELPPERVFEPRMPRERAAELMAGWERAVRQVVARPSSAKQPQGQRENPPHAKRPV